MARTLIPLEGLANCRTDSGAGGAARLLLAAAGLFFSLTLSSGVAAQALADPTRPPSAQSMEAGSGGVPIVTGPQLQSIRISAHQSSAIISGQRVTVGDHFGGAQVLAIGENDVTLKGASGVQTLKLFPAVGKSVITRSHHSGHRISRQAQ